MNLEATLSQIGWTGGGWYPIGPYFCMWLLLTCHAMHVMTGSFSAWMPSDITCTDDGWNSNKTCKANESLCQSWSYGDVDGAVEVDLTLVRDFDLVCGKESITSLVNTLYVAGVFFGNIFLGSLPDRFGRKNVCLFGNWMLGVTAFVFAFLNNIYAILIFRFIGGVFYAMTQFTVWMWVTELFSCKDRFLPVGMVYHGWSSGLVIISGIAYLVRSWRHLHLVVMGFCFSTIALYFLLPESLFWLERNGKKNKSKAIIDAIKQKKCLVGLYGNSFVCSKGASVAALQQPSDEDHETACNLTKVKANNNVAENGAVWDECSEGRRRSRLDSMADVYAYGSKLTPKVPRFTPTYWKCLALCSSFWFIDGLLYYGLQFSTQEFAGDRFLNFFLFSIVEYPATILAFFLGKLSTRRFSLLFLHFMCGLAMMLSATLRLTNALEDLPDSTKNGVFNALNLTGKFFVTSCFSVMCYVPAEVYPTNVRNTSFNVNASFSRLAAIIGTFMPFLFRYNAALGEGIFGFLGFVAAISAIWMPESKNQPLPQTMEDLETMAQSTGRIWSGIGFDRIWNRKEKLDEQT